MIRQSTVDILKEMRFSSMTSEPELQLADSESLRELSFDGMKPVCPGFSVV